MTNLADDVWGDIEVVDDLGDGVAADEPTAEEPAATDSADLSELDELDATTESVDAPEPAGSSDDDDDFVLFDPVGDAEAVKPAPAPKPVVVKAPPAPAAEPGSDPFVHLHTHLETSMLDGASRIPDAVKEAARLGQTALAMTDHGRLSGTWKFAQECEKAGIKPIMGIEAYLAIGSRFEKNSIEVPGDDPTAEGQKTKRYEHLTLLAATAQGWRNLVEMHNASYESFWYYQRIDYDLMAKHAAGIICLTGCLAGPVLGPVARHVAAEHLREQAAEDVAEMRPKLLQRRGMLADAVAALRAFAAEHDYNLGGPSPVEDLLALAAEREIADEHDAHWKALVTDVDDAHRAYGIVHERYTRLKNIVDGAELETARANLARLVEIFGKDNVYVEVMEHGIPFESEALELVHDLAVEFGLKCVATNDSHYVHEDDAHAHDAWLALQAGTGDKARVDNPDRFRFNGEGYFIRSGAQMLALREEDWWAEAVATTAEVAAKVEADVLPERKLRLPAFPTPPGYADSTAYFKHLVKEGVRWRYGDDPSHEVKARTTREVRTITGMGLDNYFLIVQDVIQWCRSDYTAADWITKHTGGEVDEETRERKKPIIVGPGRGSAAGSVVSYELGIVGLCPIRNDLLFERFLDPTRIGMPDIDVDFEKNRRDEVLAFMVQRWGRDQVARIGSFQKAKTKAAIKSAARVLGVIPAVQNRLTKAVPLVDGKDPSIEVLTDPRRTEGEQLRQVLAEVDAADVKAGGAGDMADQIMHLAAAFENLTSGEGIHACGLLISDVPMHDLVPVRRDVKKDADPDAPGITGWDGKDVDSFGLLKLDVLGLRTLDLIARALEAVTRLTGQEVTIDDIPDPDDHDAPGVTETWRMLSEGRTASVFQLESSGMTELTELVAPDSLEDLSALVALYRPGPLSANMHTMYADRKNGRAKVDYGIFTTDAAEEEVIKSVLGNTFGLTVYQEQSMILGQKVAGFDAKLTNRLRKAISKKIEAEFVELGKLFIDGAMAATTMDGEEKVAFARSTAVALWDSIKGSAAYAFNKAHSAAYGYVSYLTAYIKANYPSAFGAGVLSVTKEAEKRHAALMSLRNEGIDVQAPAVNTALATTTAVDERTVVLGMGEIKGVGKVSEQIVAEREANGPFASAADLFRRVGDLNTEHFAGLAEAGALDELGSRLGHVMVARALRNRPDTLIPTAEWGVLESWRRQHERLGLALGDHPLQVPEIKAAVKAFNRLSTPDGDRLEKPRVALHKVAESAHEDDGGGGGRPWEKARRTQATIALISGWTVTAMRSGQRANLVLENSQSRLDGIAWSDALRPHKAGALGVGTVVEADVTAKVRDIELTDDEGETTIVQKTELEVRAFHPIPVPRPVIDLNTEPVTIDLMALCRGEIPDPEPKTPAKAEEVAAPGAAAEDANNVVPLRPSDKPSLEAAKAVAGAKTSTAKGRRYFTAEVDGFMPRAMRRLVSGKCENPVSDLFSSIDRSAPGVYWLTGDGFDIVMRFTAKADLVDQGESWEIEDAVLANPRAWDIVENTKAGLRRLTDRELLAELTEGAAHVAA